MSHLGPDADSTSEHDPKSKAVRQARSSVEGWKSLTYVPGSESGGNSRRSINLELVIENVKKALSETPSSDPASKPKPTHPHPDPAVQSSPSENGL
ncbi:hypothetical protein BDD12DRAFT_902783 [Trichophaea hybrida]|nr:hypothetical protein BDD12DRAFT_902783 [Trichophaea hybrida]